MNPENDFPNCQAFLVLVPVAAHRKLKELLREPRESLGHLAPSPNNRAIIINMTPFGLQGVRNGSRGVLY